jgi:hypothetical protein
MDICFADCGNRPKFWEEGVPSSPLAESSGFSSGNSAEFQSGYAGPAPLDGRLHVTTERAQILHVD